MAFSPASFSTLRTFKPRAFIKTRAPTDNPVGEPGVNGTKAFAPQTFAALSFQARSLRGVARPRIKRRMIWWPVGRFDARVSGSNTGGLT